MREKPSRPRVPESKIREITEAVESGQYGILTRFLNSLTNAADRVDVLRKIEKINQENRYKSGKPPMLAFVSKSYDDSDFVDVALLKKSSDWLFQDDVLYRESLIINVPHPIVPLIARTA
ncbi:MAG: hypothetical protein JSS86_06230 [Cyanobacteria bacterium SZAS LIN-2]|nr:hypothetical protein [Cyanobacteria bacterium SZAS LIN-3]MBS1995886.1 hypothetical protein [Cyanobacteria bacterium SZAS LIN-2]MBS2007310.1 hypothetical protein [Cyanobacteria bacterium SZAS TMP-1]